MKTKSTFAKAAPATLALALGALAAASLLPPPVNAQTTEWRRVLTDPASTPLARSSSKMVYDEGRGVVVLHGGSKGNQSSADGLPDTWEWNGEIWRLVSINGPQRVGGGIAYDALRGVVVMYGGRSGPGRFVNYTNQFDTWEWDGQTWTRIETGQGHPLSGPAMEYDPLRKKVIRHGGLSNYTIFDQDTTWEWDGVRWTQIANGFMNAGGRLIYDANRGNMLLFGGLSTSLTDFTPDIWEFNGTGWARVPAPGPSGRVFFGFVFDSHRRVGVLYGGAVNPSTPAFNDTWEWNGSQWKRMGVAGPGSRAYHAMAYDSRRRKVVVFGGANSSHQEPFMNDTWEYGFPPLRIIAIARGRNNDLVLQWSGEAPPYQLQSRATLTTGDWKNDGAPTEALSATVAAGNKQKFFRVLSLFGNAP